jgi:hypothetical protein
LCIISICGLGYLIDMREKERKSIIGGRIILGKDTLLILNYSTWSGNYELSNVVNVAPELVKKIGVIK